MASSVIIVIGTLVILTSVLLLVALARKGSVANTLMTARRLLRSAAPPDAVYAWITQNRPRGYSVDDTDPSHGIVILSSPPTATTWGFLYPVHVFAEDGGTRVDLGITSRLFQYGPLVTRAHWKLAHALASVTQSRIDER